MAAGEKVTFKATLNAGKSTYSGVLVIRKVSDQEYRAAFFSEVGMTFVEGSLWCENQSSQWTTRQVNPFLASKNTVKDLEQAFGLLLCPTGDGAATMENGETTLVFKGKKHLFLSLTKI